MRRHQTGTHRRHRHYSNAMVDNASSSSSSSSSEEEEEGNDVFAITNNPSTNPSTNPNTNNTTTTNTSSTKRHHYQHPNSSRAAKMEAMIHQLEKTSQDLKTKAPLSSSSSRHRSVSAGAGAGAGGNHNDNDDDDNNNNSINSRSSVRNIAARVSGKPSSSSSQGSYCINAYEEQTTTNIFVGNLSPLITEEDLHQVFSVYGTLYSVKIMWPRNITTTSNTASLSSSLSSSSHTGFVCFMDRQAAENAMNDLNNVDIRNTGRRIYLNWGKPQRVPSKKDDDDNGGGNHDFITGSTTMANDIDTASSNTNANWNTNANANTNTNMNQSSENKIRIVPPSDPKRCQFIDTIAHYVAQDGSALEERLRQDVMTYDEKHQTQYAFLYPWSMIINDPMFAQCQTSSSILEQECLYYRWRVYSYAYAYAYTQDASPFSYTHYTHNRQYMNAADPNHDDTWRTEPFQMLHQGSIWIPPPLPMIPNRSTHYDSSQRNRNEIHPNYMKKSNKIQFKTGPSGRIELTDQDMMKWKELMDNLIGSKESICQAMAFCFDRSAAAEHVSSLLKDVLLDNRAGVSIDTKCARLFLLSDVLYNSQQPGVKNAFQFRTLIESMAREVFQKLGQSNKVSKGRMTMNKLRNAVRAVLSAWNDWSVFVPEFLDELESLFEGRDTTNATNAVDDKILQNTKERQDIVGDDTHTADVINKETFTTHAPSSIWMDVDPTCQENTIDVSISMTERPSDEIEYAHLIDADIDGVSLGDSEIEEEYQNDLSTFTCLLPNSKTAPSQSMDHDNDK